MNLTGALSIKGVTKHFGGIEALTAVDLEVAAGKVHALIGPNGAGKSTLGKVIAGFIRADAGNVTLLGEALNGLSPSERARRGLGLSFQDVRGFKEFNVRENILMGTFRDVPCGLLDPMLRPHSLPPALAKAHRRVDQLLEMFGLTGEADIQLQVLPFGQQRLVGLARLLAGMPKAVILDEPAAGLTEQEEQGVLGVVEGMRRDGIAVILIEHHMSVVEALADEVTVLNFGRVLANGTWDEIRSNEQVKRAYLGMGSKADAGMH